VNWFKLATNNINFTLEMEAQISEIANFVTGYYLNNRKDVQYEDMIFYDFYLKKRRQMRVIINPFKEKELEDSRGAYNTQTLSHITIFPYNINIQTSNKIELFNYFKNEISHEFIHALDLRYSNIPNYRNTTLNTEYDLRPEEFESYSKEIEITIQNNLNKTNYESLINWLNGDIIKNIPPYLYYYEDKITKWNNFKPELIKKLRIRLYNKFIKK
jgi:hypothetical protein